MAKRSDTLARLRTCRDAGQPVGPDLLADAIECMEAFVSAEEQRKRRDQFIRLAAMLTPAANDNQRAHNLVGEVRALPRRNNAGRLVAEGKEPDTPAACLVMAAAFHPLPRSARQFLRVLQDSANDPEA